MTGTPGRLISSTPEQAGRSILVRVLENITSRKSQYVVSIRGYDRSPIRDVRLENCTFNNVEKSNVCVGVENLVFRNVKINGELFQ